MRLQRDAYSCGAIALVNALGAMGKRVSERDARKYSGTTEKGVTQHGLLQAIEAFGFHHSTVEAAFDEAYGRVHAHLAAGSTAILETEDSNHWEAAVGVLGSRVVVLDGQRSANSRAQAGVLVLSPRQLRSYWTPAGATGRYGILISVRA